jgi:hypothetical protein
MFGVGWSWLAPKWACTLRFLRAHAQKQLRVAIRRKMTVTRNR